MKPRRRHGTLPTAVRINTKIIKAWSLPHKKLIILLKIQTCKSQVYKLNFPTQRMLMEHE